MMQLACLVKLTHEFKFVKHSRFMIQKSYFIITATLQTD